MSLKFPSLNEVLKAAEIISRCMAQLALSFDDWGYLCCYLPLSEMSQFVAALCPCSVEQLDCFQPRPVALEHLDPLQPQRAPSASNSGHRSFRSHTCVSRYSRSNGSTCRVRFAALFDETIQSISEEKVPGNTGEQLKDRW